MAGIPSAGGAGFAPSWLTRALLRMALLVGLVVTGWLLGTASAMAQDDSTPAGPPPVLVADRSGELPAAAEPAAADPATAEPATAETAPTAETATPAQPGTAADPVTTNDAGATEPLGAPEPATTTEPTGATEPAGATEATGAADAAPGRVLDLTPVLDNAASEVLPPAVTDTLDQALPRVPQPELGAALTPVLRPVLEPVVHPVVQIVRPAAPPAVPGTAPVAQPGPQPADHAAPAAAAPAAPVLAPVPAPLAGPPVPAPVRAPDLGALHTKAHGDTPAAGVGHTGVPAPGPATVPSSCPAGGAGGGATTHSAQSVTLDDRPDGWDAAIVQRASHGYAGGGPSWHVQRPSTSPD